ncbi:hypothetical protein [Streptomyces sp. NPDC001286]
MNEPGWYAQPFRADGGITANGLLSQLGRPSLSRLTLLVREAAQNSWDARRPEQPIVGFRLDLSTVGAGHVGAWRRMFSIGSSNVGHHNGMFRTLIQASAIRYLAVSDRGTTGLAGPTRSDAGRTSRREWARFVLNSGDRDGVSTPSSGGTYGYGKSALFQLSRAGCVLVYTRFEDEDGRLRSRFIGVAIRESFWDGNARYTGRHWWGLPEQEHCEPLADGQADAMARELGIPGFQSEETGTTLVVVDPDLTDPSLPDSDTTPELSVSEAGTFLADAAAWNLWPIMLPQRSVRMTVAITANGADITVPDAESDATLAFFASAYSKLTEGSGQTLVCGKPRMDLGGFAHEYTYGASVSSPAARELGIEGAPHHVCLLRGPELVVRYHSGPERSNPDAGYAAVFKVTDELDQTFARAEPPTHDGWEHQQLQGREATFVRTAGRRLKEQCDRLSGAQARRAVKVGTYAMGSVAQRLGHLLAGPGGTGTSVLPSSPLPGTSRSITFPATAEGPSETKSASAAGLPPEGHGIQHGEGWEQRARNRGVRKPTLLGEPRFDIVNGIPVVVQRVRLHGPDRVEGLVRVLTGDGATESHSPTGAMQPEVYGWRIPTEDRIVGGEVLYHAGGPIEVDMLITAIADALIDISVMGRS